MVKIEIKELIESTKDELLCYEDAQEIAERWESEFRVWMKKNPENKNLVQDKGGVFFKIKDEEEIFEMADSYMDALEDGSVNMYWEKF